MSTKEINVALSKLQETGAIRTHAKHQFEKLLGKSCTDLLTRKLAQIGAERSNDQYPWGVSNEAIYRNTLDILPELIELDARAAGAVVHNDYCQVNVGIPTATNIARMSFGLPDPDDDKRTVGGTTFESLFNECVDVVSTALINGMKLTLADKPLIRATLKKASMRGAPGCEQGEEAHRMITERVFPTMLRDNDAFAFYGSPAAITIGWRLQPPGGTFNEKGEFVSKLRNNCIFGPDGKLQIGKVVSVNGKPALRVRIVNNIPMHLNIPLVILSALIMDNLPAKFKAVWKLITHEDLLAFGLGEIVHCSDFSQFDNTIPKKVRLRIGEIVFSSKVNKLIEQFDTMPIATCFPTYFDGEAGYQYVWIDRSNDVVADAFQSLLSGTGDTNLTGKIIGCAFQVRNLCLALDMTPYEVVLPDDPSDNCIFSQCTRGGGDDSATCTSRAARLVGLDVSKVTQAHKHAVEVDRVFLSELERPGKFLGYLFYSGNDEDAVTTSVCHDPLMLFINNVSHEHNFDSKLRGHPYLGLRDSINTYGESIEESADFADVFWTWVEHLLHVIECPYSWSELNTLADEEFATIVTENEGSTFQDAIAFAVTALNLKSPSELDWKISKGEIWSVLPDWVKEELWLVIPTQLCENFSDFIKV